MKKAQEVFPEPEPITELMFSVPHGGANTKVPIATSISWPELQSILANIFSVPPKDVRVAYRFSTSTWTLGYNHLTNKNTLQSLFIDAINAVHTLEKSCRQGNHRKNFVVEIKDTREPQKTKRDKKKKAKQTQKGAMKVTTIAHVRCKP